MDEAYRKDFLVFSEAIGLPRVSAEKMLEKLISMRERFLAMCADSYLSEDMKASLAKLISERLAALGKTAN